MRSRSQFEYEVVLDSELDSKSAIPNWIGSPPSRARLLGSPAPSLLRLSSMVLSLIPKNN
jgi:hypothetical protein